MKLITFLITLLLVNVMTANNCQEFLTMQGKEQEMSIMLCISDNPPELSNTNMNKSLLNLSNHTNYNNSQLNSTLNHILDNHTNYNNNTNDTYFYNNSQSNSTLNHISSNTTENIIDLDLPDEPNITTTLPSSEPPEEPTEPAEPTEPEEPTDEPEEPTDEPEEPTEPAEPEDDTTTTDIPIEISTTPSSNLRGTEKNTTNNSKFSSSMINEQKLEETMIIVILFCCLVTLATVIGFVWIYCKHKKQSILPETEQNNKIKKRRVSPELPKDLMIEKITEGLQYTNKYRNSSKFKRANTIIKAAGRLQKAQQNRTKKGPFPPNMKSPIPPLSPLPPLPPSSPPLFPPPPPPPSIAMEQVKIKLTTKDRNSWSIKKLPTNTKEISNNEIIKTNASDDLSQKN